MDPASNHWDQAGFTYASLVYEPLAVVGPDGTVHPYLARTITPNDDYTRWTVSLRPGIRFHDGTPFDARAVVTNLEAGLRSPLTGQAYDTVSGVTAARDDTVVLTMRTPWVPFAQYLAGQVGYMASPAQVGKGTLGTHPVGTGPFRLKEWNPDAYFRVERNPDHWRGGPHVDAVEVRPVADSQQRAASLRSGDLDVMYCSTAQNIVDFRHSKDFTYVDDSDDTSGEPTLVFFMVNCDAPPLDDVRLRRALALATDQETIVKIAGLGVGLEFLPITGPFAKGSPYYADTGYPTKPDLAEARRLVAAVTAEKGRPSFTIGVPNDPAQLQPAQLLQAMWEKTGAKVAIEQVEQATYITNAVTGKYEVYGWIQFGARDPDANYVWWSPHTAAPIGQLALNFARNRDQQVQRALDAGRTTADPAARTAAYREIGRRFAEDVPYIWVSRAVSAAVASPKVHGFTDLILPDGSTAGTAYRGLVLAASAWVDG